MRRILVVDDDPHVRLAIRSWLKRYGFRVSIADGGAAGLAALDNASLDLMIVDIFMPNMRSYESISRFHNHAPTEAEPHRKYVASLAAVSDAASNLQQDAIDEQIKERSRCALSH